MEFIQPSNLLFVHQALERSCRTDGGYSGIRNVYKVAEAASDLIICSSSVQQFVMSHYHHRNVKVCFSNATLMPCDFCLFYHFPVKSGFGSKSPFSRLGGRRMMCNSPSSWQRPSSTSTSSSVTSTSSVQTSGSLTLR